MDIKQSVDAAEAIIRPLLRLVSYVFLALMLAKLAGLHNGAIPGEWWHYAIGAMATR